jgi:rifampicin phosphotransferase
VKKLSLRLLKTCTDPAIAGRKAAGLARLLHAGFNVPPGLCVTTYVYQNVCAKVGLDFRRDWQKARGLEGTRREVALMEAQASFVAFSWPAQWSVDLFEGIANVQAGPTASWAIRSSATNEDAGDASGAGLYRTELGVGQADIPAAVRRCWESLWDERVFNYYAAKSASEPAPAMAVIIQPMVAARVSGVAFSRHPVTGRADEVLINAVPGLAAPLVSGRMTPDEYVVRLGASGRPGYVSDCQVVYKPYMMRLTPGGTVLDQLAEEEALRPSLTDDEAVQLAASVQEIEKAFGVPVDVEWAFDQDQMWFLQARPISGRAGGQRLTNQLCDWSRANFKETLPEVPSPLGLSYLEAFMDEFIVRHYRELGCVIPEGVSAVRTIQGRPFINVTLLQSFLVQLGGHPELVTEQMGGEGRLPPMNPRRLPPWKLVRGYFLMHRKVRRALRCAPAWFEELKRTARTQDDGAISSLPPQEVVQRIEWLGHHLRQSECTFAIVAAVGQAQQMLGLWLSRWLGSDWRSLLNRALQGQDTIISAQQVRWLREIGERGRHETRAAEFFLSEPWEPALYRERLAGTNCLVQLEAFLTEYGHRAVGESDLMTTRFGEDPSYLLEVVRRHIANAPRETADQAAMRQQRDRASALALIRRRFGWRYDRWLIFRYWYGRLCRASELREANRHHLMYYATATRRLAIVLGRQLTVTGRLSDPDDVFFVTTEEFKNLVCEPPTQDWKTLVAKRRATRRSHAETRVPDFVPAMELRSVTAEKLEDADVLLRGVPIGPGIAEGRVVVVRGMEDIGKVKQGDIIVTSVIDPGMATLFGLASGLIADMGGTLSHGAIIVREYGIPAIVNVFHATRTLKDGECVKLNATEGLVYRTSA